MSRRTKIVCTLGPATSDFNTIRQLVRAGMDVARLNFSHGDHAQHHRMMEIVREAADAEGRNVAILQDLQGPKIRVGEVAPDVHLRKGDRVVLTSQDIAISNGSRLQVSYDTLADDVEVGNKILVDDGHIELLIVDTRDGEVETEVLVGGPLSSRKGVNLPDIRTNTPALTEKDLRDLDFGLEHDVDIIALSFVRDESDVRGLVERVQTSGKRTSILAKIEKPEAVRRFDQVLRESDGIMVARGDLGIEMPIAQVPSAQKMIIRKCLRAAKPVITATQMLESMIENPRPTRAEASDVANAVLDGTDAVMLSGETAMGRHPVRVVEVMAGIVEEAERDPEYRPRLENRPPRRDDSESITDAVSFTAFDLAEQIGAAAIACLTASGATARSIARHRPGMPVFAFTDDPRVVHQLNLVWGTHAFAIPFQRDTDDGVKLVQKILSERGYVAPGSHVVMTAGMPLPAKGRTNMVYVTKC
jgi:pyruvate kinase